VHFAPGFYFFFEVDFFEDLFFDDFFDDFLEDFLDPFFGTFAPASRASDKPIAIACFLLVTFLPDLPLLSVPCLRSCIAFSTLSCAFLPYLAIALPPLEILDRAFMLLGCFPRIERSEIPALTGLRICLAGIKTVFT